MNKIKNAADELEFIQTATPEDLVFYVAEHPFRPRLEKEFVERKLVEPLLVYIEKYGLRASASVSLFKINNPELTHKLIAWGKNNPKIMHAFLNYAPYEVVKEYVDNFPCPELREQAALESFDEEELLKLCRKKKLSHFAKCDMLARGSDALVKAVIQRGNLQERELDMIMNKASKENVERLLQMANTAEIRQTLLEAYLIRFKRYVHLKRLIKKHRLNKKTEKTFLSKAPINLLVSYVQRYHPKGGDIAILSHPDRSQIIFYLSKNWLSEEGENLLMKRGHHDEIKAYIKMHILSPKNEVRLIKRCKHREIMLYMSKHTLSLEASLELVTRGQFEEICYMAERQPLADDVIDAIKKLPKAEMIEFY